jgi:hypothetical protein
LGRGALSKFFSKLLAEQDPPLGSIGYNLVYSEHEYPTRWRTSFDALWPEFEDLAERKFAKNFIIDPFARAWEMQLGVALRRRGLSTSRPKSGPDFLVEDDQGKIWIEAIVATSGVTGKLSWVPPFQDGVAQNVPVERYILRLTTAMEEKRKKRNKDLEKGKTVKMGDRFIIAVCAAVGSSHFVTARNALQAVFPMGHQQVNVDLRTNEFSDGGFSYRDAIARADPGAVPISTTAFLDPKYAGISALLFWETPFVYEMADLGKHYSLIHNHVAEAALERGWWGSGVEYWAAPTATKLLIHSKSFGAA